MCEARSVCDIKIIILCAYLLIVCKFQLNLLTFSDEVIDSAVQCLGSLISFFLH